LNEASEERRPAVQVGDPFTEKLLIEACIELIRTGVVVGIQDMGAAGLTSSSSEMASRAGSGIDMDIALVKRREQGMTPYEIMLSESQERMLVVPRQGCEDQVKEIFSRWGLEATVVGQVTTDGILRIRDNGTVVAEIPAKALSTDGAPLYHPDEKQPEWLTALWDQPLPPETVDLHASLLKLMGSLTIANKAWVFRQYDTMVQTNTVAGPGPSDASVLRVRGTERALAMTMDCNSRYCYLDPYLGGASAVAEAARNIVCSGGQPIAVTDGLNFGNPEKPEVYWQLHRAVDGISVGCRALGVPVTGGNVSLYNETEGKPIYPTPVIGMVGVLDSVDQRLQMGFQNDGDQVILLGETKPELGGSEYLAVMHQMEAGRPPELDLELERQVQAVVLAAAHENLLTSAHDCSEGGLAVALAESCLATNKGVCVNLRAPFRADAILFGESQSRIIVSLPERNLVRLQALAVEYGTPLSLLGRVGGSELSIELHVTDVAATTEANISATQPEALVWSLSELAEEYFGALPARMDGPGTLTDYLPTTQAKGAC
jgi:phosphoribosylformylglycinamidine synthase